ncbi:unnamed protein product [Chironomus riparius]|uniref:C2H2-type domain-containing protein n=1 Tax=Chironomus riparius TaxID=315576 RepID=A0A9N9S405_9DIPT|nr:unnamed protein product [Chironomus riparius]
MEVNVKEELQFDTLEFLEESVQCCLLCPDIKSILNSLADHVKKFHYDAYTSIQSLTTKLCDCNEVLQLQIHLVNHLISSVISKDTKLEALTNPIEYDSLDIEKAKDIEDEPESSTESDIEDLLPKTTKKRGRKPKQLKLPENVPKSTSASYLPPIRHSQFMTEPQFPCDYCPKILYTKSGLSKHYNMMHNPDNKFKCTRCSAGHCNTLKNLHAHMRAHEDVRLDTKVCRKCDKKFQTEKQLYHHMLLHREKLLECDHCGMRFNMKQPLQKHIFTHFDIKIHRDNEIKSLCEICSKWVTSSRMKRHLGTHFTDCKSTYKCDHPGCDKAFTEVRNLQDHQNMHKNLKPYVCEFCNMAFRHRAALRQHRMRHTEPEKHKCEVCMECFVTNQSLRKHMTRQHQDVGKDVRSFACDYEGCNSIFKYEDFLFRHKKDVHNPKPQIERQCEHCSYTAHNTKNYFQHMRRSHNIRKRINNRVFPTSAALEIEGGEYS